MNDDQKKAVYEKIAQVRNDLSLLKTMIAESEESLNRLYVKRTVRTDELNALLEGLVNDESEV